MKKNNQNALLNFKFRKAFLFCIGVFFLSGIFFPSSIVAQKKISSQQVIPIDNLHRFLKQEVREQISDNGNISQAALAKYFRSKFSERYFYDWKDFEKRLEKYNEIYPQRKDYHTARALDHFSKYPDSTQWVLPFNYLNGKPVNAYALRHLARQHKMVDLAFHFFNQKNESRYIEYFVRQVMSLNVAFIKGAYEKIEDGNGVYEAFRSGYRVLNWLQIHNMFLGQEAYSDTDQLTTIATLLQHGEHLYERNAKFKSGNHQTRGMSALAMLSILFIDFEGTDRWYERSMDLLKQHLSKEINDDGFQFERSVHYHMSDIGNYYYVYQLAKISGLQVDSFWEEKLKTLFITLTKIAYPDRSAPVLQDDTNNPWGEKNDISGALTLGYLLFEDPVVGYFANDFVQAKMYWYLSEVQLKSLEQIKKEKPTYGSLHFPTTGYFIMREGWEASDDMMIISNGLDDKKPDHQHGDMLGIQAMSNGKVILPNYQVRYSLKDFDLFKNSMVKNVALVDDELQGKMWTSNKGGSGFGKFKKLPNPKTVAWKNNAQFDLYVGSHDGFENVGVQYSRQVVYVKNDFWIVKDNFKSREQHTYKQIWQGHYTKENHFLIRSTFDNASGCDILQLRELDHVSTDGKRGKEWTVIEKEDEQDFNFITVIFPYQSYNKRINEENIKQLKGWEIHQSIWKMDGMQPIAFSKDSVSFIFDVKQLKYENFTIDFSKNTDVYIMLKNNEITLMNLGASEVEYVFSNIKKRDLEIKPINLIPGEKKNFKMRE